MQNAHSERFLSGSMKNLIASMLFLSLFLAGFGQGKGELLHKAQAGDPGAMMEVAQAYRFGDGLPQIEDSADYWIRKAAELDYPDAAFLLGLQYCSKIFSQSSYDKGIKYLKKAAGKDHPEALERLAEIYRERGKGTQTDRYYSLTKSFGYLKRAAALGQKPLSLLVAESYLEGRGVKQNDSLAFVWMDKAAGVYQIPIAQLKMGDLCMEGRWTGKQELFKAYSWYKKAYENPLSNIDARSAGDIGMHSVDQVLKGTHNLMLLANPILLKGSFEYELR